MRITFHEDIDTDGKIWVSIPKESLHPDIVKGISDRSANYTLMPCDYVEVRSKGNYLFVRLHSNSGLTHRLDVEFN